MRLSMNKKVAYLLKNKLKSKLVHNIFNNRNELYIFHTYMGQGTPTLF